MSSLLCENNPLSLRVSLIYFRKSPFSAIGLTMRAPQQQHPNNRWYVVLQYLPHQHERLFCSQLISSDVQFLFLAMKPAAN
jgi:hypothetical protein